MAVRVLVLVALVGCRYHGVFVCQDDSQCSGGRCELTTGYCSFADGMCPSGFRYGDSSGGGYANECVDEQVPPADAGIDATPDAASFNVAMCPLSYNAQIASTMGTSRYRLIVQQANFWTHAANCDDDLPGKAHLVMPQNVQEIIELSQYIDPIQNTGSDFYIGAVQAPASNAVGDGWILLDGMPLDPAVWEGDEPNDGDGIEDADESSAFFDKTATVRRSADINGQSTRGAVCECDGKTYSTLARAYIAADPNNPN